MTRHASDPGKLHKTLEAWPEEPWRLATALIDDYGPPDDVLPSRLIWHQNGAWKRTEVLRDRIPHAFPDEHGDLLEQTIDYFVPPEKANELLRFDGSITFERTKGELSARSDREAMNILAINLAHDIVVGNRPVEEARKKRALTELEADLGKRSDLTKSFNFSPVPDQGDPDERVITKAMMKKVKDLLTGDDKDPTRRESS